MYKKLHYSPRTILTECSRINQKHIKMISNTMMNPIDEYCINKSQKKQYTQTHVCYTEREDDEIIRWKHRSLKRKLIAYTNNLPQTMTYSSATVCLSTVKSFYRYFEIENRPLTKLNKKNSNVAVPISFKDLPDKEVIRTSLEITTPMLQSAIFFMASSGCSRKETLNLTIPDCLDSVNEYNIL